MSPSAPDRPLERAVTHEDGPLLVRGGGAVAADELLARRFARLVAEGASPEGILVACTTGATRSGLRSRVEGLLDRPFEELWIGTWTEIAERLLRVHSLEAGLDPFFVVAAPADRLAELLERLDELPLRRHEIRGNPAGVLARLLERIDVLKGFAIGPQALRERARDAERSAGDRAAREAALRELELAELYEQHDAIMLERGALDEPELVLTLRRLLVDRPDLAAGLARRFEQLMVAGLEDASRAQLGLLERLASHRNVVATHEGAAATGALRGYGEAAARAFEEIFGATEKLALSDVDREREPIARAARAAGALAPDSWGPIAEVPPPGPKVEDGSLVVRFWRCANERAQAQAVAREIEHLVAAGECRPEAICVLTGPESRDGRLVAAALEERSVRFSSAGAAAFLHRPEVRDAIAWLRALADPTDAAAAVRALSGAPIELPSADLARCTTIARRRKLDMISAVEAALDSPQLQPPSRDRLRAFLKLYRSAGRAMEELRADLFVRRLVERVGFRRHRLFAASPETAERLVNLSRLAELAASWAQRRPDASTRDFVSYLSAVAEAGQRFRSPIDSPPDDAVLLAEPDQVKGMRFDRVYLVGLDRRALLSGGGATGWLPDELLGATVPPAGPEVGEALRAHRAYVAMIAARRALILARPETTSAGSVGPSPAYEAARVALGADEEAHAEELFGPAEGLHSTYRMLRDEVLEASWRAGSALSEMRLDTAEDVNRAVARFLELLKTAALIQRPGGESERDALGALNDLLGRVATPEQLAELERSSLDSHLLGEARDRGSRQERLTRRTEPGLEPFLPRRGDGLALSASDIDLYRTCPLKYKFARVFAIPQEPTINQRFGILIHQVLERYHSEELRGFAGEAGGIDRLLELFEAGWRRAGFGASDDELQYRDRAVAALARYHERHVAGAARPVWLERPFSFSIGDHSVRGRIDRVDRHPDGSYELIDYKTGEAKAPGELTDDVQIALYRIGVREDWEIDAADGSYWYVLDDEKVPVAGEADDVERVERTVLEVAAGIGEQDFEPRPDFAVCSWCDYRLICPASEA